MTPETKVHRVFLLFFCLSHSFALSSLFTHGIIGLYRIPNSIGRKLWEHTYATEDRGLLRLPSGDGAAAAAVLHSVKKNVHSIQKLVASFSSHLFCLMCNGIAWFVGWCPQGQLYLEFKGVWWVPEFARFTGSIQSRFFLPKCGVLTILVKLPISRQIPINQSFTWN